MKEKLLQVRERAWAATRDLLSLGFAVTLLAIAFGAVLLLSAGIAVLKFVFVAPGEKLLSLGSRFPRWGQPPFLHLRHS